MIILASSSPRRQELLKALVPVFKVETAEIEEVIIPSLSPTENVVRLAQDKALAVKKRNQVSDQDTIIGCDTIVVCKNEILGKPKNEKDATNMLCKLSGGWHSVYTGVCVLKEESILFFEETKVYMKEMEEWEIESYIKSKDPFDKAGAYGIQGEASKWIEKIEGDYFNVVGLPVSHLYDVLKTIGEISR